MREAFGSRIKQTWRGLLLALSLRLFFVFAFPHVGGDSLLYEACAHNLLRHHVYSHYRATGGAPPAPSAIRTPGYPLFLAAIFLMGGDQNETAVRITQALLDTATCLFIALIVFNLARGDTEKRRRIAQLALLLAAVCPFIGNYAASILAEVPTTFLLVAAWWFAVRALKNHSKYRDWFWCGILTGMATLFRPESGLWLTAPALIVLWRAAKRRSAHSVLLPGMALALGLLLPLAPWTARNGVTLKIFQPLAPANAEDSNEFVPYGYLRWCKTWLWKFCEVDGYLWTLNKSSIAADGLPSRATDGTRERTEVTKLLRRYNQSNRMDAVLDAEFARLASRRIDELPVRYYLVLPVLRGLAMWFTPRREILPLEGKLWPVSNAWENDPRDFLFTLLLFLINSAYVALAAWGGWKFRKETEWLILLVGMPVIRTVFLACFTFPEPRYVLEVYPAVIILAVLALGCKTEQKM